MLDSFIQLQDLDNNETCDYAMVNKIRFIHVGAGFHNDVYKSAHDAYMLSSLQNGRQAA